jgi:translocation and assembly module TamB
MQTMIPVLKKIALTVGIVLVLLVFASLGAYGWLQTVSGKQQLVRWIEEASQNDGQKLTLGSLQGTVPSAMMLTDIAVSDSQGLWLKVDRLEFHWNPWSLLQGEFRVMELSVQTVDLLRKPIPTESEITKPIQENNEPFTGLPVRVRIDRLAAENIRVGEEVLGEEIQFTLKSRMAYRGLSDGLSFNLNMKRIDRTPGTMDLEIAFLPVAKILVMDLNAHEPPGGLLVRTLNVPDLPAMAATIKGNGTLEDWKGRFQFQAGPSLSLDGEAGLKMIASEQYALNFPMQAKIGAFMPPELRDAWGDSVDFNIRVISESFKRITIEALKIAHPAGQLEVGGDVNLDNGKLKLKYSLIAGKDEAFATWVPDIHWNSLKLAGTGNGFLRQPTIDLTLEAEALTGMNYLISRTRAQFQITPDRPLNEAGFVLAVSAGGSVHAPKTPDPALSKILPDKLTWGLQGSLDLDDRKVDLEQFELLSNVAVLKLKGRANRWGEQTKIKGTVGLPQLSRFSELAKTKIAGNLNLELDVESEKFGKTVRTQFTTVLDKLVTEFPEVNVLAGNRFTIGGTASLESDGLLQVERLEFKGDAVSGALNATLTQNQMVDADLSVIFPRLDVLSATAGKELSGQLRIRSQTQGPLPSPTITASLDSKNLIVDGFSIEKSRVDLTVENLQNFPAGTVATQVVAEGWEAIASTEFALQASDQLALKKIKVAGLGAEILGNLQVDLSSVTAKGTLKGKILDYSKINKIIQQDISGATRFKVDLSNEDGQTVRFAADLDDFALKGDSPLAIKKIGLSAKVTHALKEPVIESRLQLSDLDHPSATVQKLLLTAQGSLQELGFKLETEAKPNGVPASSLKASGRLKLDSSGQELQLITFSGKMGDIPFQTTQPALLLVRGSEVALRQLSLKIQDGSVSSNFKKNSAGIFADLTVHSFPLKLINQVYPGFGVQGNFKGKAILNGNLDAPSGQLNFSAAQLTFAQAEKRGLSPARVDLQGSWEEGLGNIDFIFNQPSVGEFIINGEVPLVMVNDPVGIDIPGQAPLKGSAEGQVGLDILNDILVASGSQVRGKVDLAVKLEGTVDAPQVAGTLNLKEGRYENLKLGTTLDAIELLTSFDGNQLKIDNLSARTPKDGVISASGTVTKSDEEGFIADLTLNTKSAQLVAIDTITSQVTSDLQLRGPVKSAALTGEIIINRTEIYVPNNLPPSVVVLEVEETDGDDIEETIQIESGKKEEPQFDMDLNLTIKAPDQVFVRGRGLDAELEGDLLVTGSIQKPKVDGAFKLRRGTLDLLNRKVKFKQGVVSFDGVPKRDPDLDFKAEVPAKNMTILVAVLGAVSNPKFVLSSIPEMPQDEILANFLFDKSAGAITPIEAVQLANSAAQLAGMGGQGPGVMDKVRSSLGLDTLKFSGDDSGPGVEAGRYVAEGVYIGVKQGLGEDSSGAVLEYEVTPNITVESDIGADANSRVGISMEWDY